MYDIYVCPPPLIHSCHPDIKTTRYSHPIARNIQYPHPHTYISQYPSRIPFISTQFTLNHSARHPVSKPTIIILNLNNSAKVAMPRECSRLGTNLLFTFCPILPILTTKTDAQTQTLSATDTQTHAHTVMQTKANAPAITETEKETEINTAAETQTFTQTKSETSLLSKKLSRQHHKKTINTPEDT